MKEQKSYRVWLSGVAIMALCLVFVFSNEVQAANDYLEKRNHYQVYAKGLDCIHFKIPVWSSGGTYHYHTTSDSYVFYTIDDTDTGEKVKILNYYSDAYDTNDDNKGKGNAYVNVKSGQGDIIITSMYNGVNKIITERDKWSGMLYVKQIDDSDPRTILEFDWYPPESLDGHQFTVGIHVEAQRSYTVNGKNHWDKEFTWGDFQGRDNVAAPQLFTPYLYQIDETGLTGYGYAGIVYTTFQTPVSYVTSLHEDTVKVSERSGNIFVMTNDSIQEGFHAKFKVYRNEELKETQELVSTTVDIPPYHRIYGLSAVEETDSTGTFTGNNILRWSIKNPILKDIVEGDYFEVQRALSSDFSDAHQLAIVALRRDSVGEYEYVDNSREIWTGNAAVRTDTISTLVSVSEPNFIVTNESGDTVVKLSATLTSDKLQMPGVPVYYRLRRASSAIWGWNTEFAKKTKMIKNNFLSPLSQTQEDYTLDADYDNNHKINFRIKLENAEVHPHQLNVDECTFKYSIDEIYKHGDVTVTIKTDDNDLINKGVISYTAYDDEGDVIETRAVGSASTILTLPYNSKIRIQVSDGQPKEFMGETVEYTLANSINVNITTYDNPYVFMYKLVDIVKTDVLSEAEKAEQESWIKLVKDSLYSSLRRKVDTISYGKTMWDRSAKLVLVRTITETGQRSEFVIPSDSIKRQADGTWLASFSDVADKACMHYTYAARIDQVGADLRVEDPQTQLLPVPINGPTIYYDEGASISSFTASQGDARTEMKRGVLLDWMPSNSSVDEYVLQRRVKGSDAAADTIYVGQGDDFFDLTAVPDVHYEYTVTANYNCNGKFTSNYATTEGWRTPYAEISGSVVMGDNSGIKKVVVSLQGHDGEVLRSLETDATGTYKFDSLTYDIATSTDYVVIPSHQYGKFSFNHTNAGTAAITLSADNAVASGINFINTSTARLTGRVLYKNSTIPVSGAMFLLDDDTVRRGNSPVTSGIDGNFELILSQDQVYRLQVFKPGHTFEGDGVLRVEGEKAEFALTKALDGVRFYDMTKVRLIGRVAGGNDQRDLPEGFGFGKNNLGDDLQLVLQLEGDNTAQLVHDPNDLNRDTIQQHIDHFVYQPNAADARKVGSTSVLFEKRRIIVQPDPQTGEYQVDLFPVRYKVTQATARGYATLFSTGAGSETFDLTNAPLTEYTAFYNQTTDSITITEKEADRLTCEKIVEVPSNSGITDGDSIHYNAIYDRIYHNPVKVELVQNIYGIERVGFGEPEMETSSFDIGVSEKVKLYTVKDDGSVDYLLGYPVFYSNRKYQFKAKAYEDYYYNNNPSSGALDRVPQRGGKVTIHNGLHNSANSETYQLDKQGQNSVIWLEVDNVDVEHTGADPLRNVSVSLEMENNTVETDVFSAYVSGTVIAESQLRSTPAQIELLDIVRDPGGAGSSAYVESGSSYDFGYSFSNRTELGIKLTPTWGLNVSTDVGVVAAPAGAGSYTGSNVTTSKQFSFDIPISHTFDHAINYSCTFTTNDRIQTSSSPTPMGVGSAADVFMGTTISQITGKAKTVSIIDDSIYRLVQPAIEAGAILVVANGIDKDGKGYHLVTGTKVVLGSTIDNTFVYTQKYIAETLIPQLAMERQSLLMNFNSMEEAKSFANKTKQEVYWYHQTGTYINDTLPKMTYEMVLPDGDEVYVDRVSAINNMLVQWLKILYYNEREKVEARTRKPAINTYSVSDGATLSHNDSYTATGAYSEVPLNYQILNDFTNTEVGTLTSFMGGVINAVYTGYFSEGATFGTSAADALQQFYKDELFTGEDEDGNIIVDKEKGEQKPLEEIGTVTNTSKFSMKFTPIYNADNTRRISTTTTTTKNTGFTIGADPFGDITVSVYLAQYDSIWAANTDAPRNYVRQENNDMLKYSSYVFYTEAGSTFCPHEDAERTKYYNKGTILGNATAWVAKPELSANIYEVTNVAPDKRATFRLTLYNQGQIDAGLATEGANFFLRLDGASNPDGAKVYINGAPLNRDIYYWIAPGSPVVQTLEVERGTVDDYNLRLIMFVDGCARMRTTMDFSVHFLPVASDVAIASPRQNWVMNTLSPQDSVGYYLPIDIDGFDIYHKNFDHIEFQYKLSTESDEKWVNQCSFYASDSLYQLATGSKAMIENGKIVPFRFYGERDPMEQKYDLRAVSFCRYGSGFITKASPVISGTKDTRPPRVFGEPEPANSILGVGDNLLLRFNEPIAGNYLDEDNNFQLMGFTNETGIAHGTSLHFDGKAVAETKVERSILGQAFSIDMMIRPSATNREANVTLFETFCERTQSGIEIFLTTDNCIGIMPHYQRTQYELVKSKTLGSMLEFTRIVVTWKPDGGFRIYAGTLDVTDTTNSNYKTQWAVGVSAASWRFGYGYVGDMLETRIWAKALTLEEVSATAGHYLTGYERELLAYYRMNEGKGKSVTDRANGATLYLNNCSWKNKKGFSLRFDSTQTVTLNGNLLGRSKAYDETMMFWFKTEADGSLFAAGRSNSEDNPKGTLIAIENGQIVLHSNEKKWIATGNFIDSEWHHLVLTINRTFDHTALFVDGNMYLSLPAFQVDGITGMMYLGGNGFKGHIDEFAIFEQSLPKSLVDIYYNIVPAGDEMGLIAYLPFEEQILNANGILEQVFSLNNQRQLETDTKKETLVINEQLVGEQMSDEQNAPTNSYGLMTKLRFDWSFNGDELMINILNQDREINKQSMYITVRDVEDLNGNPMLSPVTWAVFVDRNSLKWERENIDLRELYGAAPSGYEYVDVRIVNHSGKRHQYTIESLPKWLTVDEPQGTIEPLGNKTIRLHYSIDMPVGNYIDIVYLTDENGLSESLEVKYTVDALPPYNDVDKTKYPLNMSICGRVMIEQNTDETYDTDPNDVVYAIYRNECIGMANVTFDQNTNTSDLFLTVYGNGDMQQQRISFILWQASTGKTFSLIPPHTIHFVAGSIIGCGNDSAVIFRTYGSETQNIILQEGWNWISFNVLLDGQTNCSINDVMWANELWTVGDIIKNPALQQFSIFSTDQNAFVGSSNRLNYNYTYMIFCKRGNVMHISADQLPNNKKSIQLNGNSSWSAFPCLFDEPTSVTDALADYYNYATPGDMIKSHDRFAVFSKNGKWVGDLQTIKPGEGYLFFRRGSGEQVVNFYESAAMSAPKRLRTAPVQDNKTVFSNPNAADNMTLIAKIATNDQLTSIDPQGTVKAYIGEQLAGVTQPLLVEKDTLLFLTVASTLTENIRFIYEQNGCTYPLKIKNDTPKPNAIRFSPHAHCGSLSEPLILIYDNNTNELDHQDKTEKRIIDGNLYIFRGKQVYNAQGTLVNYNANSSH